MSQLAILLADQETGEVRDYGALPNAWLGAMHIWVELAKAYKVYPNNGPGNAGMQVMMDAKPVWALAGERRIPGWARAVLTSTFHHWLIRHRDVERFATDLYIFGLEFPGGHQLRLAHHLAEALRKEREDEIRPFRAVGFWQTTVADNPWVVGERPYNLDLDTGHHWIYDDESLEVNVAACPEELEEG